MRCLIGSVVCLALICVSQVRAAEGPSPAAPAEPTDMQQLFNGKDLTGWEGDMRLWSFKDGVIRGETTKENATQGNTFLVWKGGDVQDFELRLSFKIHNGNSGVQYRSKLLPAKAGAVNQWVVTGYQAEVEDTPGKVGFLYHEKGRAYLCNVGEKCEMDAMGKRQVVGELGKKDEIAKQYHKTDWNDYVIIAEGNHLRHYLNGYQTIDLVDNDPKGKLDAGILALQIHAGPPMVVEFKNVRLKQIKK